jgi:hypothetical protein
MVVAQGVFRKQPLVLVLLVVKVLFYWSGDMKALIAKNEPRETGFRVAQVVQNEDVFGVSESLEWVDCPDSVVADTVWYDPTTQEFCDFPKPILEVLPQPTIRGAQTL